MAQKDKMKNSEIETLEEIMSPETDDATEKSQIVDNTTRNEATTLPAESEEEINATSAADEAKKTQRRNLWLIFGACLVLALVLPASFVYLQSILPTSEPQDLVIVPVVENSGVSNEETKTAKPGSEKETDDPLGEKYEDWDYHQYGRNLAEPRKGPRVLDSSGEINPEYYDNYLKASGINEPHVADLDLEPLTKSGTNPEDPSSNQGDGTKNSSDDEIKKVTIRVLVTHPENNQASFLVDDVFSEVTLGGQIGGTNWFLNLIDGDEVQITNGDEIFSLTVRKGTL